MTELEAQNEFSEKELQKTRHELLEIKVECNKLKTLYNNDVLDNYEKSIKQVNNKLELANEEITKLEEIHKDELENVSISP